MSRDTAYRVFRGESTGVGRERGRRDRAAVAEAVNDRAWGGSDDALAAVVDAYKSSVNGGGDAIDNLTSSL